MHFFKVFIVFIILFFSSLFAHKINEKEWAVFIKTYRKELFYLNFPQDPNTCIIQKDDFLFFMAMGSDDQINYSLSVSPNNTKDYFSLFLKGLKKNANIEILEKKHFQVKEKAILDVIYKDKLSLIISKNRIITTKNNIYNLLTVFPEGEIDNHQYFISSFMLGS